MKLGLRLVPAAAAFVPLASAGSYDTVFKFRNDFFLNICGLSVGMGEAEGDELINGLNTNMEEAKAHIVNPNGPLNEAIGADEVESNDATTKKSTAATSESPISSTSYYASMSSSPTIYNMDFSFGSPYSGRAENSAGPATIKVSSLDDMCKSGGITVIILMVIVVGVLVLLYLLCHGFKGTKKQSSFRRYFSVLYRSIVGVASNNATSTSLLYNKEDGNLSTFRRVIMVPLEKVFVKPMVPADLSSYVIGIFMCFFITTIPMAATRYYEGRWAHHTLVLQGPLNVISLLFGCKSLDLNAVAYTQTIEEWTLSLSLESTRSERIDYFFSLHLIAAVLWLLFGFIQIYYAKEDGWSSTPATNWMCHRILGLIATIVLCAHICMMAAITSENPVNQHPIIILGYVGMICSGILNFLQGIRYAMMAVAAKREENRWNWNRIKNKIKNRIMNRVVASAENVQKHKMFMFNTYVRTTMGSGSIRIAAWALLLVGNFLSPETRVLLDRGACQSNAEHELGDATNCWRPVFLNMLFTDLIVIWLELLFLVMPANLNLAAERNKKRDAFERQIIIIVPSLFLVLVNLQIERWLESSSLPYSIVHILKNLAEFSPFIWYLVVHVVQYNIRATYSHMCEKLHAYRHVDEQEQNHSPITNAIRSVSSRLVCVLPERNTLKGFVFMLVPVLRVFTLFSTDEDDSSGVMPAQPMRS